jgi:hypothetical protein
MSADSYNVPEAPFSRRDDVIDIIHGVEIADPYRWLEDATSPDTKEWIAAQNQYTRSLLEAQPSFQLSRCPHRVTGLAGPIAQASSAPGLGDARP